VINKNHLITLIFNQLATFPGEGARQRIALPFSGVIVLCFYLGSKNVKNPLIP